MNHKTADAKTNKTERTGKYDVLCIGTALIDAIVQGFDPEPVSASGYRAQSCSLNVGGEAVNEVIALSKLGVNAGILCFLGTDMAGKMIESSLKQYGAGTDAIQWEETHPTPITTMLVRKDSSRSSITNPAHRYYENTYVKYGIATGSSVSGEYTDTVVYTVTGNPSS